MQPPTHRPTPRRWTHVTALITIAIAALLSITAPATATEHGEIRSAESDSIDQWITDRMAVHGTPGAAVAVVRGGEIIHLAGYGAADPKGRPVTPDTPFVIGSSSKPFTAMVIRQLVDEGQLSLDEPVLPHIDHLVDTTPDGFADVTIGQLLNHTGGLSMKVGLAGTVEIHDSEDALDRRVAEVLGEPMTGEPGAGFEYSNAGAMILASVTEQVTGQPFADTLRQRIFDPLGMTNSFATDRDPRAQELATGHRQWFGRWVPSDLPYDNAGVAMGYIASSARDLTGFLQAHLDGDPAAPATAAEIVREQVAPTGWDEPLEGGYGLGWFVDDLAGQPIVSHSGTLGHFTAHLIMAPEADLGIAVVSNSSAFIANGHEGQYDLSLGLTRALLDQAPDPTDPSPIMTILVPLVTVVLALLIAIVTVRHLRRVRSRRGAATAQQRRVRPGLISGAVYLVIGVALVTLAPLDAAREFYPDAGWGATVMAYLAIASGLLRLAIRPRAAAKQPPAPSSGADHRPAPGGNRVHAT